MNLLQCWLKLQRRVPESFLASILFKFFVVKLLFERVSNDSNEFAAFAPTTLTIDLTTLRRKADSDTEIGAINKKSRHLQIFMRKSPFRSEKNRTFAD